MKVVGIIAEYNPFHKGHAYQIKYAREVLKADYIIVAMSGPFTQRGQVAIFDKYSRAKEAVFSGADLVLELPVCYATASAEYFAKGGVSLLANTGIVDTILFGCECDDMNLFDKVSEILVQEPDSFKDDLQKALKEGNSFAKARATALKNYISSDLLDTFLASPNNILAIEYMKAIKTIAPQIKPVALKRKGSAYHDLSIQDDFASASALRQEIYKLQAINSISNQSATFDPDSDILSNLSKNMPGYSEIDIREIISTSSFLEPDDLSLLMQYKFLSLEDFSSYLDCNDELNAKIKKNRYDFKDLSSFCQILKSKNYSYTRISRVLCHILLDIKKEDITLPLSYLRLLGTSQNGLNALRLIKEKGLATIVTSPKSALLSLDEAGQLLLKKDIYAADIYRMLLSDKTKQTYPNEFNKKFEVISTDTVNNK